MPPAPTLCLQPIAGQPGEGRLLAHADSLQQGQHCCSVLGHGDDAVWGAEHLLAALECCGVDNARIELEGGRGEARTLQTKSCCSLDKDGT